MALDSTSFNTAGTTVQQSAQNPMWYQEGLADILSQGTQIYDQFKNQSLTPYAGQVVSPNNVNQANAAGQIQQLSSKLTNPALVGGLSAMQAGADQLAGAGKNLNTLNYQMGTAMQPYQGQLSTLASNTGSLGTQYGNLASLSRSVNSPYMADLANTRNQMGTASQYTQGGLDQFMNPYTSNVVDRIATLGNRNFNENILPGVLSQFGGAGQYGSKRMMDFVNRGSRDTQDNILGQQSQALNQGYQQAQQNYADWANRGIQGLNSQAALSGQASQMANQNLTQAGQFYGQQGQAYNQQAGMVNQQAQLGQFGLGQQAQLAQQQAQLGGQMGQMGLQQDSANLGASQALNQVGNEAWNRSQLQNQFDLAQWNAQQQAPWQSYSWLSNIVRGLQPGQVGGINYSASGAQQPIAASPSQMVGGLGSIAQSQVR
jgi:hypothetical protein